MPAVVGQHDLLGALFRWKLPVTAININGG
jgi:hypothetical protein